MKDKELVQKVRSKDQEALSIIINQYYSDIFRFCLYMIQSEEDAYDITQETFLKFIRYGTSYPHRNLKGYLLTIARNICFTYFQDKKRKGIKYEWEELTDFPCRTDKINETELSVDLGSLLSQLSQEMREVLILRIYEEMKFKDIAQIMGCSVSTAKSRFRLGVAHLKKLMEVDYEGEGNQSSFFAGR